MLSFTVLFILLKTRQLLLMLAIYLNSDKNKSELDKDLDNNCVYFRSGKLCLNNGLDLMKQLKRLVYTVVLVAEVNSFFAWLWFAKEDKSKNCVPGHSRKKKKK